MKVYRNIFEKIISIENLFSAWKEFKKGKQKKKDVMEFEFNLEENIFNLHREFKSKTYKHGNYYGFYITDPKIRHIHKANVKDRVIHHAVYSVLNPIFEPTFIYDSYSCRKNKGTHKGVHRLERFLWKISKNNFKSCFIMKCDIRKFFESVNHNVLISIIEKRIKDENAIWLVKEVIQSFSPGLPIGNLTSQMFANIYLNEFDQFVKQEVKIPFYLRYTDDFIIIAESKEKLEYCLSKVSEFLSENLKMELHPNKIIVRKYRQGIDFLGYVQFPHHRVLRTKTKRRIIQKIKQGITEQSLQSYLGVLSHANSYKLSQEIKNLFWFNKIKNPEDLRDSE
ncbi:MAG: RNA-directed DNA polymerase (Reverse transcriptase) [Parcubacteria group bacterium Gr01-1014_2]|nr:MAG: RNA-directed DNA polymerase (Reverse transcriptase) [Parcubacteria group bacterium Gr01-1014_2]